MEFDEVGSSFDEPWLILMIDGHILMTVDDIFDFCQNVMSVYEILWFLLEFDKIEWLLVELW